MPMSREQTLPPLNPRLKLIRTTEQKTSTSMAPTLCKSFRTFSPKQQIFLANFGKLTMTH